MNGIDLKSESMTNIDAAWLHMETPTNMAMITGIFTFNTPVDFARYKKTIEARLLKYPRFHMRVREPRLVGIPTWEPDPHFDINAHVHRIALPAPGDRAALQTLVGDLMSTPLDFSKPLWQFHFVDGYGAGSAVVCRLHHCVGDGLSLVQVMLSLTDETPDAPLGEQEWTPRRHPGLVSSLLHPAVSAVRGVRGAVRTTQSLLHEGWETLAHPSRLVDATMVVGSSALALSKLTLLGSDQKTLFRGPCGVRKVAAWTDPIPLGDIKAIGKKMDSTINDVMLAAATAALRRYLEALGQPVDGLNIRAMVPVNLRPNGEVLHELGNRFGLVLLSLPVGVREPLERLRVLKERMDEIKDTPEAMVAFGILNTMGMTPAQIERLIVRFFADKSTLVMTNVPGPRQPLYLAGQPIHSTVFWVPAPGGLGVGVSIMSYNGQVMLGVMTDAGLVPDPETIIRHFYAELEELKGCCGEAGTEPAGKKLPALQTVASQNGRCQALTKEGHPCKNLALPGETRCRVHHIIKVPQAGL